jgi:hypothetical protein
MSFITITTLPHLVAIVYTLDDMYHTGIIVSTTAASVIWHTYPHYKLLFYTDYMLTLIWYVYEMYKAGPYNSSLYICSLYTLVFALHAVSECIHNFGYTSYSFIHGIWHIISVVRAIHTARYLYQLETRKIELTGV